MAITKSHILDEIKRTAATNDGVPLGFRRFFSETGIKESDWSGVHWVKWSDALAEAGFCANEFIVGYDNAELLTKYADLTLQIGRLPVQADLRIKARNDPTFPSDKPFRRFGTKHNLVRDLAAFVSDRAGYETVTRLCEDYLSSNESLFADEDSGNESIETTIGFVYLMKSGRFYKIGHSNATGRREYELAIQLPEKLTTVHAIRTDDPVGIEAYWHNRFKDKRKNGEWFDLTAADISAFKRRKFM